MGFADILVHLDSSDSCAARLDAALVLATRCKARLTGLYVITHQYYQPRHGKAEKASSAVQQMFEQKAAQAGVQAEWQCADWSVIGVGMTEIISHHAHCADLVIIGQSINSNKDREIPPDMPERLVLGAGRPVLIVPYAGTFSTVGERVLVAWKAGRESTRAVHDSLPLLTQAQRVDLLAINSSETYGDDGVSLCANICEHLVRHGVAATGDRMLITNSTVGDALLNRVCEEGYDLLVMGAYAHSPQGKMSLGTVARHLLEQMTVPVLMSH